MLVESHGPTKIPASRSPPKWRFRDRRLLRPQCGPSKCLRRQHKRPDLAIQLPRSGGKKFNWCPVTPTYKAKNSKDLRQADLVRYGLDRLGPLCGPLFCSPACHRRGLQARPRRSWRWCPVGPPSNGKPSEAKSGAFRGQGTGLKPSEGRFEITDQMTDQRMRPAAHPRWERPV